MTAEDALREAEERFRVAFDHAPIGMALIGLEGRHLRVNHALCDITGYPKEDLLARTSHDITHPDDLPYDHELFGRLLAGGVETSTVEKRYLHAGGATVWARLTVGAIRDREGALAAFLAQVEDVTARKEAEEQLVQAALHDPLTGLHNRALFIDRLTHALARSRRAGAPVAVLFVDLDHFKGINDAHGHRAGDEILVTVARKLEAAVRPSDTVARIGGDEFAVLCEDMSSERDVVVVAERLYASFSEPVLFDDERISVTGSMGIAFAQEGDDPDRLLRNADAAMYKVKEGGRGSYEIFLDAL
jgi:diguanylate cyclase (GGDEF)-like protein/PAS domain S-box-containing protein